MKTTLFLLLFSIYSVLNAQLLSVAETNVQLKKADALYKEGKSLLIEFVLMQDTARHTRAFGVFQEAKVIYDNLMTNGQVEANDWSTTIASVVDAKLMVLRLYISLYGKKSFRDEIMAETSADRTKKVTYKGTAYKVSKASKKHFENLNV